MLKYNFLNCQCKNFNFQSQNIKVNVKFQNFKKANIKCENLVYPDLHSCAYPLPPYHYP